jgi:hypothetical protein
MLLPPLLLKCWGCRCGTLTLITEHDNTKKHPEGSPALQTLSSLPAPWSTQFPFVVWVSYPCQHPDSLLSLLTWARGGHCGRWRCNFLSSGITVVSLWGTSLSGTKTSRPAEHKVTGTGSIFLVVLGFELKTLLLLGRYSTIWTILLSHRKQSFCYWVTQGE